MLQFFKIEDPNIKILDFSTTVVDGEIRRVNQKLKTQLLWIPQF